MTICDPEDLVRKDAQARIAKQERASCSMDSCNQNIRLWSRPHFYARLLECADSTLTGGYHAIIDATFLARSDRQMFAALAQRRHCPFLIVSCSAGRQTLAARLDLRSQRADDPSEATLAVLDSQLTAAEPLGKEEFVRAVLIDTESEAAISTGIRRLQAALRCSPCR